MPSIIDNQIKSTPHLYPFYVRQKPKFAIVESQIVLHVAQKMQKFPEKLRAARWRAWIPQEMFDHVQVDGIWNWSIHILQMKMLVSLPKFLLFFITLSRKWIIHECSVWRRSSMFYRSSITWSSNWIIFLKSSVWHCSSILFFINFPISIYFQTRSKIFRTHILISPSLIRLTRSWEYSLYTKTLGEFCIDR